MSAYFWIVNILALFLLIYFFILQKLGREHFKKIMAGTSIAFLVTIFLITFFRKKIDPIERKKEVFVSEVKAVIQKKNLLTIDQVKIANLLLRIPEKSLKFSLAKGLPDDLIISMGIVTKINYLDHNYCQSAFQNEYPINNDFFVNLDTLSHEDYTAFIEATANSLIIQIPNPSERSAFEKDLFIQNAFTKAQWSLSTRNRKVFKRLLENIKDLNEEQRCQLIKLVYIAGENLSKNARASLYSSFFDYIIP